MANLYAQVFASAAEAHELVAPFNAYSRGWGERFGRITKDEEIDGLGDEAWLLRAETSGTEVTYHWRRGNSLSKRTFTASGSAQVTSAPPRVPGLKRSTRLLGRARRRAEQRRGLGTQGCAGVPSLDVMPF
jgi:hypothetical protein